MKRNGPLAGSGPKRIESSWEHSHSRSDAPANRRCNSMKPGHSPALAPAADGQPDP